MFHSVAGPAPVLTGAPGTGDASTGVRLPPSLIIPFIVCASLVYPTVRAQDDELEQVIVTGSRIARPDFDSASPIGSVTEKLFQRSGSNTVESSLNTLPQFVPAYTSSSNNPTNNGQANLSLRGLGTTSTLVLVDGKRLMPANGNGVADLNIIPSTLIESVGRAGAERIRLYLPQLPGGFEFSINRFADDIADKIETVFFQEFVPYRYDARYNEHSRLRTSGVRCSAAAERAARSWTCTRSTTTPMTGRPAGWMRRSTGASTQDQVNSASAGSFPGSIVLDRGRQEHRAGIREGPGTISNTVAVRYRSGSQTFT